MICPRTPDIRVRRVLEVVDMRHNSANDNRNEHTGENEKASQITDKRKETVHEEDDKAAQPGADNEADERMPSLRHEAGMHEGVH